MELFDTTRRALLLLFSGDAELWQIVWVSLKVSVGALVLVSPFAIAAGYLLATRTFPGKRLIVVIIQALFAFPTRISRCNLSRIA